MNKIITVQAGKVETETITTPAHKGTFGMDFPEQTTEQFIISEELKTKFLRKVFAEAKKQEGEGHSWHIDSFCVKCTHSSPPPGGLTDYNDSIDCDAAYSWEEKIAIRANGKIFSVEENYGKWTAYREVEN